mmetsp:Transcript_36568/g.94555  ORF Transcript_36568/g.94555 Transcript_36568/m.94555 type:complete len:224 (-) Transcript_36568:905-1576(-)
MPSDAQHAAKSSCASSPTRPHARGFDLLCNASGKATWPPSAGTLRYTSTLASWAAWPPAPGAEGGGGESLCKCSPPEPARSRRSRSTAGASECGGSRANCRARSARDRSVSSATTASGSSQDSSTVPEDANVASASRRRWECTKSSTKDRWRKTLGPMSDTFQSPSDELSVCSAGAGGRPSKRASKPGVPMPYATRLYGSNRNQRCAIHFSPATTGQPICLLC